MACLSLLDGPESAVVQLNCSHLWLDSRGISGWIYYRFKNKDRDYRIVDQCFPILLYIRLRAAAVAGLRQSQTEEGIRSLPIIYRLLWGIQEEEDWIRAVRAHSLAICRHPWYRWCERLAMPVIGLDNNNVGLFRTKSQVLAIILLSNILFGKGIQIFALHLEVSRLFIPIRKRPMLATEVDPHSLPVLCSRMGVPISQ